MTQSGSPPLLTEGGAYTHHFEGRLVYVENTLFFMKKYAKHLGYALGPADTLQIKWQIEDAA